MATFNELSHTETNAHHKAIFETIAKHENADNYTADGYGKEIALDASELETIRDEMSAIVQDARPGTQTAAQMREQLIRNYPAKLNEKIEQMQRQAMLDAKLKENKGIVQDGYDNPVSGIGTFIDPGMQTEAFVPISILPQEATAYYASAGLPARVIDKKAGVLALEGVQFECEKLTPEDIAKLEDHAMALLIKFLYAWITLTKL